ncbi:sulfatase [uncultured Alistipes sp.]|jgi:arylsulfatase|uniref:sulfatase n=1 Tax=uncultured Alistipes sp. TaxID=538949 RepID=UPI0025D19CB7|nr:sulfatase [uncultured Alistipes sp.]
MNPRSVIGLAPLPLLLAACSQTSQKEQRPNIVMFLVDDLGWPETSVAYGDSIVPLNRRYNTPNMELMASQGIVMSDAYACPVSTPSRASLITGMNAARHHITNWTHILKDTPSDLNNEHNPLVTPADWNLNGVNPEPGLPGAVHATPLAEILRQAGYYTIHAGKAHWATAGTPGSNPLNMGFVTNISGNMAGMPRSYYSEDFYGNKPELQNYYAVPNMQEYFDTGTFLTEALTREAFKTLRYPIEKGEPFFLHLAHYATHTPIQGDPRFIQKYLDAGLDQGQARFASLVEGVDKSLGDVMRFLRENGLEENTIILFMTDNGGNSESKQKGGELHTQNLPLREGKASVYEGGIRVPMMVKWPGKVAPGSRSRNPVIIEDFFPSILDMAGVKNYRTVQQVDGRSFVPVITGQSEGAPDRELVFHYPHKWKTTDYRDIDYLSAMRKGDWKVVYRMIERTVELYNLKDDIGEHNDLAAVYPEKLREMTLILGKYLRESGSRMPTVKATGAKVPYPDELFK